MTTWINQSTKSGAPLKKPGRKPGSKNKPKPVELPPEIKRERKMANLKKKILQEFADAMNLHGSACMSLAKTYQLEQQKPGGSELTQRTQSTLETLFFFQAQNYKNAYKILEEIIQKV